jgi:hypothetical protein
MNHHSVSEVLGRDGGRMSRDGGLLAVLKMAEYVDQRFWGRFDDPEWHHHGAEVLAYVGISGTDFEDIVEDMVDLLSQH